MKLKRKNEMYDEDTYDEDICDEDYVTENETKDKNHKKTVIFLITAILVSLTVLLAVDNKIIDTQAQNSLDESNKAEAEELEDIKEQANENVTQDSNEAQAAQKRIDSISKKVNQIIGANSKYYGIVYYDLSTGTEYTLNADTTFHAASTIKVPIAMMIGDKINNNEITMGTQITYQLSDYSSGSGVLQNDISKGEEYSVEELLNYMIKDSDNIATAMLKRTAGDVHSYVSTTTGIAMTGDENYITPRQSSILLKKIYDESDANDQYRNLVNIMLNTNMHDRLDKYVPRNIVAHKIGDYESYVNDIGIIYAKRPYILCIYTKGMMEEGREDIAKISKAVYDIVTADKL